MKLLQAHSSAIAVQDRVQPPIAIADVRLADLYDSFFQKGRIGAAGLVMITETVERRNPASPPDRYALVRRHTVDQLALPIRPQSSRLKTTCSIS